MALPMDTCGDTLPPRTHGRVAATMPSQAHAGAAQEAPDIGQWEGQDVPLVRPSSCNVKGGIPSSRRYLPTYLRMKSFTCFRKTDWNTAPRAHSHQQCHLEMCTLCLLGPIGAEVAWLVALRSLPCHMK